MKTNLREAHAHVHAHGRELSMLNLGGCGSRGEAIDVLAAAASRLDAAKEPGWLVASGLRVEAWKDAPGGARWPTRDELDRVCAQRPVLVMSFDHHAGAVNSSGLAASGFGEHSADPAGGVIVRDERGVTTGLLLETAFDQARASVPEPSREQWKRIVTAGIEDLKSKGFTEVHDLLTPTWLGEVLAELHDEGRLGVRVKLYAPWKRIEEEAQRAARYGRPTVELAGGKVFVDGTLNSRTAWMLSEYREPLAGMPCGKPMVTAGELDEAIGRTRALGLHLASHAIGDGAVRAVLDAYARAGGKRNAAGGAGGVTGRIEHAELVDEKDVPRFAELGVVCSVQPCHLLYDIEALVGQLAHRLDRVLPLRELIEAGCEPGRMLWFGSDTPIVRPDPEDSIVAAVKRGRVAGSPGGGPTEPIAAGQAISEEAAWSCFRAVKYG